MNLNVRIASAAYVVPPDEESVEAILERERRRVEATLAPLTPQARQRALDNLGLCRVRVCREKQPYDLALEAATAAIAEAGIKAKQIDFILDFSTFPGESSQSISPAHRLSADLGADSSLNLSFRAGGCGALHLAIQTALGWMSMDERIRTALLVTGDCAPPDNRSLLPITVQGDAASAVILRRDGEQGPLILGVDAMTLGHLHKAIAITQHEGRIQLIADAVCIEHEVMPIFYLHLFRLANKVLADHGLRLSDVDHFIYSNISRRDRDGFRRMVGLAENGLPLTRMTEYGHTFASDLIINYAEMRREGRILPGQLLLFASAGIGFTWGVTLARA
ncbi:MAG: 3-oxoacyl-[acyl-carrier-protein] synthase III C-terminal domain-containing protein [Terracidiphilus sp.]